MKLTWAAVALLCAVFAARDSHAASGVITGTLKFQQNQGHFCPNYRDCTGARYLQAEYGTYVPIRQVKVYVKNNAGTVIGQGTTGVDGVYNVQWTSSTSVTSSTVYWVAEHANGRYHITDMNSVKRQFNAWTGLALIDGTTAQNPQNLGLRGWGGAHAAAIIGNVNDSAWRMWQDSLSASSIMVNRFTNLKIMTFTDPSDPDCPTACANGPDNRIKLGVDSEKMPMNRTLHEMGHIAAYKANSHFTTTDYCYPNVGTNCGWSLETPEWGDPAFEEGFATFLGDRAFYWQSSVAPHTCGFPYTAECPTDVYNIESSLAGLCGLYGQEHHRHPLQVLRYLWDLYDSRQDTYIICGGDVCAPYTDTVMRSFSSFFAVYDQYPTCWDDHCDNEPYGLVGTPPFQILIIDDRDGRSGSDFKYHFELYHGTATSDAYVINCQP